MNRLYFRFKQSVCLFTLLAFITTSSSITCFEKGKEEDGSDYEETAIEEDGLTQIIRGPRATVQFRLPGPYHDGNVTAWMGDSTVTYIGDDYEVSLMQQGNILFQNANINYESDIMAVSCSGGKAFSSTKMAEFLSGTGMKLNQAPVMACKYNACLTTFEDREGEEITFSFILMHPYFHFSGKGPLSMKATLLKTLHSFAVYALDPKLTEPNTRPIPTKIIDLANKLVDESLRAPTEGGIIEKDTPEAMSDIEGTENEPPFLDDAIFEPFEGVAEPVLVNMDESSMASFLGEPLDDNAEISFSYGEDNFGAGELFYIPPGGMVTAYVSHSQKDQEEVFKFRIPEKDGLYEGDDLELFDDRGMKIDNKSPIGLAKGKQCACGGSRLPPISLVNRVPLISDLIDRRIAELKCLPHWKTQGEHDRRMLHFRMLDVQIDNLDQLIKNLLNRVNKSIPATNEKIKEFEAMIKQLEKEITEAEEQSSLTVDSKLHSMRVDIKSMKIRIKRPKEDYDKLIDFELEVEALLEKAKLPKETTIADIDKKIRDLEKKLLNSLPYKSWKESESRYKEIEEELPALERDLKILQNSLRNHQWPMGTTEEQFREKVKKMEELVATKKSFLQEYKKAMEEAKEAYDALPEHEEIKTLQSLKDPLKQRNQLRRRTDPKAFEKQLADLEALENKYAKEANLYEWAKEIPAEARELKKIAEEELFKTKEYLKELEPLKQDFEKHEESAKNQKLAMIDIYAAHKQKPTLGNLRREGLREIKALPAPDSMKSTLEYLLNYGSDEFWTFEPNDFYDIGTAFTEGYLSGLNPYEMVQFIQYVSYITILTAKHPDLASDEVDKVLELGVAGAQAFLTEKKFANQLKTLARIYGGAKGEIRLAKISGGAAGKAIQKIDDIQLAAKKGSAKYTDASWTDGNRNGVMDILFKRTKKIDQELWEFSDQWRKAKIDDLAKKKKITPDVANQLKDQFRPIDLYYLNQGGNAAEFVVKRLLKKSKGWNAFWAMDNINGGMTALFDRTRDKLIKKNIGKVRKSHKNLKFADGYTGSAEGVDVDNFNALNLRKDRDLLFTGPDRAMAMKHFVDAMELEFGPNWREAFDCDAYLDAGYDNYNRLIPDDLPPEVKAKADVIFNKHRAKLMEENNRRIELAKEGKGISTTDDATRLLYQLDLLEKTWMKYRIKHPAKALEAFEEYLRLNRKYFLSQKDAYIPIGGRLYELELRGIWAKKHGLAEGPAWEGFFEAQKRGNAPKIPMGKVQDALEGIAGNKLEVKRNLMKSMEPVTQATKVSKYYERIIRTSALNDKGIDLFKEKVNGKSLEDLRRTAMKIKEGKDKILTQKYIGELYGKTDKNMDSVIQEYLRDLESATNLVESKLRQRQ